MPRTVSDLLKDNQTSKADADAKAAALVEADKLAKDAKSKADASYTLAARVLKKTGQVFLRGDDGKVLTFESLDGEHINRGAPLDASATTVPDDEGTGTGTGTDTTPPTDDTDADFKSDADPDQEETGTPPAQ